MNRQDRIKKIVKLMALMLCIGVIYTIIILNTNFGIPCMFKKITGFSCPGCGITGVFLYLFRLDFKSAFMENPMIICISPLLLYVCIRMVIRYINENKTKPTDFENKLIWFMLIVAILFGIIRNLV